jgi:drug/metabolite transporter (DMT)-like permease
MILRTIALVFGCVLLETSEQTLYRLGGRASGRSGYWGYVAPAIGGHVARMALWYLVLKTLPLGEAVPLLGVNYVTIALVGRFVFGERVDGRRWLGTALVAAGIVLVGAALE